MARISRISGAPISSWVPAIAPRLRQLMLPLGAPASSAAAATIRAARKEQSMALGWGEKTMALPLLMA
ncbi:MAG: hypothetical protein IIV59_02195, partial [Selenomonadaceae bacterium]|nr:hypothetical protein [Selenomonadaceae bacterium]